MINLLNPVYAKTDNEILRELGGMLKQRRINNNFTQQEFANAIGISKDQLSKIERTGKTTLATLVAISRKYNLLQQLLRTYEAAELTPMQKYEIERKTAKLRIKRKRVRK
ncbi:MAG: helix-turn-helix domain-containing protein [Fibromonadaceae bacterium]|jgi:transcriptional regulator with XRE-family HTH domain|nr:helix-turn-helix domain-containing protein [Fibromonadaceae bacterium]